jgi:peptidyl-prolyl cis-trans isomerase SurA
MPSIAFLILALLAAFPVPLWAQSTSIVAIVNDEAITSTDVENRMGLIFLSSGLPKDDDTKKRIRERVMKNLIDEKLEVQEARRYNIEVADAEVDEAVGSVAKQNRMTPEQLDDAFRQSNVPRGTLVDQIRSTLSWTRLIQRVLRPQVEVGDDEVSAALERLKANEGKPEYLLSEIFLAVENPEDDQKIRELGESLILRMQQGAQFSIIAQQFSQGTGAISGGDIGWVQPGQLPGEMDRAAQSLAPQQVSLPIRMPDGYHILGKREERIISAVNPAQTAVRMKQASAPLEGRSPDAIKAEVERFKQAATNCTTLPNAVPQFPDWRVDDLGDKKLGELPGWLARLAQSQKLDVPGEPLVKNDKVFLLYVCERNDSGVDRQSIVARIGNEKLELQARRLLRDLYRSASIERR